MVIRFGLLLWIQGGERAVAMDDQWTRETANRIKKELESKKTKQEQFVETQKLKRQLGPGLWDELRTWLKQACDAINKEMHSEVAAFTDIGGGIIKVQGKGPEMYTTMTVKFQSEPLKLEYESEQGSPSNRFEVVIDHSGHAAFGERDYPSGRSVADIGKEIMKHALRVNPY